MTNARALLAGVGRRAQVAVVASGSVHLGRSAANPGGDIATIVGTSVFVIAFGVGTTARAARLGHKGARPRDGVAAIVRADLAVVADLEIP